MVSSQSGLLALQNSLFTNMSLVCGECTGGLISSLGSVVPSNCLFESLNLTLSGAAGTALLLYSGSAQTVLQSVELIDLMVLKGPKQQDIDIPGLFVVAERSSLIQVHDRRFDNHVVSMEFPSQARLEGGRGDF